MSHNAEESENCPESPHLGGVKRMRKQCVPGAPPIFVCAGDEAMFLPLFITSLRVYSYSIAMYIFKGCLSQSKQVN